jgi:hypothetical protein
MLPMAMAMHDKEGSDEAMDEGSDKWFECRKTLVNDITSSISSPK